MAEVGEVPAATGQCYVCFEDGAPPSRCACKDRYLHVACMTELMERRDKMTCDVCLATYSNIQLKHTWWLSKRGKRLIFLMFCFPGLLALSCIRSHGWLSQPYRTNEANVVLPQLDAGRCVETVFELLVTIMTGIGLFIEGFLYRRGVWRLLRVEVRVTKT